jgi:hypothetical protein
MPTAGSCARTWLSLVTSGVVVAALSATNFRSSRSAIMTKASGSTGPVNSPSGRNRSATLAQSRPGILCRIVSVSRRVSLFQTRRKCPARTATTMRAAALLPLKPAATNTLVSITTPFMRTPCCEQSMWGDQGDRTTSYCLRHRPHGDLLTNCVRGSDDVDSPSTGGAARRRPPSRSSGFTQNSQ